MAFPVTGTTKILGIIGHPVSHSLSPLMHNTALEQCDLDFMYVPFDVAPEHLQVAINGLRALKVAGINVTIPHKQTVMPYLDELDASAEAAGAVNTIRNDNGRLIGYNTDGDGLIKSLADDLHFQAEAATILLLGAGGAARGAVAALCRSGAARILIHNRTYESAEKLAADMYQRYPTTAVNAILDMATLENSAREAALIINTTSVGMKDNELSFPCLDSLAPTTKVYDMVYAPPVTPLLREAAKRGLQTANGLGMLACQGELAFAIWTGVMPPPGLMKGVLSGI